MSLRAGIAPDLIDMLPLAPKGLVPESSEEASNNSRRQSNCTDIDRYIGKQVQNVRRSKDISLEYVATSLKLSVRDYQRAEAGQLRFAASDMFDLRRQFDIPLSYFFSYEGEYFSDVILDDTEMADVFHYFSQVDCPKTRLHLLKQIKLASTVF